jgi:hypothetical protein
MLGPSDRAGIVFDTARRAFLQFGGHYNGALSQRTWEFTTSDPPPILRHPQPLSIRESDSGVQLLDGDTLVADMTDVDDFAPINGLAIPDLPLYLVLGLALIGGTSAAPLPDGNSGIASRYPSDAGIGSDPAVIFADDTWSAPSSRCSTSRVFRRIHDLATAGRFRANASRNTRCCRRFFDTRRANNSRVRKRR